MVSRRCTQRKFLLKPSRKKKVGKAFRYCIARAATLTGVRVHVVCVMSNHYHVVVTDPLGLLPYFTEILNKNLSRCLNALYGRWENFWAGGAAPSYVRLQGSEAVLRECVYALTNPVEAGLVASREEWPGELLEQPGKYGVAKPDWFFRSEEDGGKLPDIEFLELTAAPLAKTTRDAITVLKQACDDRENSIRQARRATGRRFMGAEAVMRQRVDDNPETYAPRRRLSPTVASRDKWRRIELLQIASTFKREHRRCMEAWMTGDRGVIFPFGTYKMRVLHRARIAEA